MDSLLYLPALEKEISKACRGDRTDVERMTSTIVACTRHIAERSYANQRELQKTIAQQADQLATLRREFAVLIEVFATTATGEPTQ
jgi:hypothetical protein